MCVFYPFPKSGSMENPQWTWWVTVWGLNRLRRGWRAHIGHHNASAHGPMHNNESFLSFFLLATPIPFSLCHILLSQLTSPNLWRNRAGVAILNMFIQERCLFIESHALDPAGRFFFMLIHYGFQSKSYWQIKKLWLTGGSETKAKPIITKIHFFVNSNVMKGVSSSRTVYHSLCL